MSVDGGTLYTLFSHFVDLLYWMIGDIATVEAITGNQAHGDMIEFEDMTAFISDNPKYTRLVLE